MEESPKCFDNIRPFLDRIIPTDQWYRAAVDRSCIVLYLNELSNAFSLNIMADQQRVIHADA